MWVWHNGDMPRSTNVVRSVWPQKRHPGSEARAVSELAASTLTLAFIPLLSLMRLIISCQQSALPCIAHITSARWAVLNRGVHGQGAAPSRRKGSMLRCSTVVGRIAGAGSVGLVITEYFYHRQHQDFQVQGRGPASQVVQIMSDPGLHLFQLRGLAACAIDLGQAGDAGPHLVADHVALDELAVLLVMGHGVRPRSEQTHAALQHVDELRQFVERITPQEAPDRGNAAVGA